MHVAGSAGRASDALTALLYMRTPELKVLEVLRPRMEKM